MGIAPTGRLLAKFAIPAIISMLVNALYNIVDQIFIGQGVGMLGHAATHSAFPVTTISTAAARLLGIGGASNYNLEMGAGKERKASEIAGSALATLVITGVSVAAIILLFLHPLLVFFGATDTVMPYATDYVSIIAIGLPFFTLSVGGNHLIRADRSPTYSMMCTLTGAIINTILDPLFIFGFKWGIKGGAWATVIGQVVSAILVVIYFTKFRKMYLDRRMLKPKLKHLRAITSLGLASGINQIAIAAVQIVMNNILRYYGAASVYGSDIPIACVGIVSKVNMVFLAICIGISQGAQPIWGFNYGARKYDRVHQTYRYSATACTIIATIFFLCFQLFPHQIVGMFGGGSDLYFKLSADFYAPDICQRNSANVCRIFYFYRKGYPWYHHVIDQTGNLPATTRCNLPDVHGNRWCHVCRTDLRCSCFCTCSSFCEKRTRQNEKCLTDIFFYFCYSIAPAFFPYHKIQFIIQGVTRDCERFFT